MIVTYIFLILIIFFLTFLSGFGFITASFFSKRKLAYLLLVIGCILINLIFLDLQVGHGLDIDRYAVTTQQMQSIHSWKDWLFFYHSDPVMIREKYNLLFLLIQFIASRFRNYNLLSFICSVLSSLFITFPFLDFYLNHKNLLSKALTLCLSSLLIVGFGFYMASVLRWELAVTSLFLLVYIYFIKLNNQKKYIWMLLVPILFHTGIILGVAIVILASWGKKISFVKGIIFSLGVLLFFNSLSSISIVNDSSFLGQVTSMSQIYAQTLGSSVNQQISDSLVIIDLLCILFIYLKYLRKNNKQASNFRQINFLLIIAEVLMVNNSVIFTRYLFLLVLFSSFYLLQCFEVKEINKRGIILAFGMIVLLSGLRGIIGLSAFDFTFGNYIDAIFVDIFTIFQNIPTVL